MEKLSVLLNEKYITKEDHSFYLMFNLNSDGRAFLKEQFERSMMEELKEPTGEFMFSFIDGRRSVWRDIKNSIQKVNFCLEEMERDENE